MALWDKLKAELIDIVEWLDDTNDTLAYRFELYQNEIKYGAKLVVREGQMAAFVNEGKLADVYKPGTYELNTQNMPILTTLRGWKYGFNSPFKAEVYFISTRKFTDLKWGTPGPAMMRDRDFGMIRATAFGLYAIRVKERDEVIRRLGEAGIGTGIHYPVPVHLQECYQGLGLGRGSFPVAETCADESFGRRRARPHAPPPKKSERLGSTSSVMSTMPRPWSCSRELERLASKPYRGAPDTLRSSRPGDRHKRYWPTISHVWTCSVEVRSFARESRRAASGSDRSHPSICCWLTHPGPI